MRWLSSERPDRSAPVRVPGPSAVVWLGALLLAVAWLFAVLVCATYDKPATIDGGSLHRAWLTLRSSPIALTVAAFVGLIATLYFVRRLILRRYAWRPGPIEAPDFATDDALASPSHAPDARSAGTRADVTAGTPQDRAGPPIARLSMQFRERLAAVHLQAPEAFPAAPEAQDFLQLLTGAVRTPANVLGTIAGLLTSTLPRSAYRVKGTLLQREGAEPFGVEVHIVTAPHFASPPLFFWAVSWDVAVERAAYAVAAYLLPRTKACRRPPWTGWQGIELPRRLVGYGTRASEAARARHYDRALDLYFKALAEDPRNLELRLETGLVQEKLALWLDAFATYNDIVEIAKNSPAPFSPGVRKRTAWRAQRRIVLLARYRRAILLGFGERLATRGAEPTTGRGTTCAAESARLCSPGCGRSSSATAISYARGPAPACATRRRSSAPSTSPRAHSRRARRTSRWSTRCACASCSRRSRSCSCEPSPATCASRERCGTAPG